VRRLGTKRQVLTTRIRRTRLVSIDHFTQELSSRLRDADKQGATTIVITSAEICSSIPRAGYSTEACCEAMQTEVKPGDDALVEQDSGSGMTVRYRLPRPR
jgi:hypothetical protein